MSANSLPIETARATGAIAGIQRYFSGTAPLTLAGASYTPAELVALLQAFANAVTALAAVRMMRAQRKQTLKVLQATSDPSRLADFGFTPRKVAVQSAAKAASSAKAKATREAKKNALAVVAVPALTALVTSITTT